MEFDCAFVELEPEWLAFREGPGEAFGVDADDDPLVGGIRSLIMSSIRASSNDSMRWPGSKPCKAETTENRMDFMVSRLEV